MVNRYSEKISIITFFYYVSIYPRNKPKRLPRALNTKEMKEVKRHHHPLISYITFWLKEKEQKQKKIKTQHWNYAPHTTSSYKWHSQNDTTRHASRYIAPLASRISWVPPAAAGGHGRRYNLADDRTSCMNLTRVRLWLQRGTFYVSALVNLSQRNRY